MRFIAEFILYNNHLFSRCYTKFAIFALDYNI